MAYKPISNFNFCIPPIIRLIYFFTLFSSRKEVKIESPKKSSSCAQVCYPLCNTAVSKDENTDQDESSKLNEINKENSLKKQPCNFCSSKKLTNSLKLAALCPGCKKAFQLDPLCPWRKSYSLSDIESRHSAIINKQTRKDNVPRDLPDHGSPEDHENCPSTLLEPWDSLLIPKATAM